MTFVLSEGETGISAKMGIKKDRNNENNRERDYRKANIGWQERRTTNGPCQVSHHVARRMAGKHGIRDLRSKQHMQECQY